MKLRTSFFNKTVLKKDITRFAPAWGLYTIFMLMYLFLIWADEKEAGRLAGSISYIIQMMGIVNFAYGGLCAMLLFGDLFSSKLCNALHAMPMRREGWFLTHTLAGLLFCIVPNCIGTVIMAMILQEYTFLAFIWLGITVCQFVFFFGTGAFCMQCAGNRLGAAAVYALFNFLSVLAAFLVSTFYSPVLYGIEPNLEALVRYSPVVGFTLCDFVLLNFDYGQGTTIYKGAVPQDWLFLFICLVIGLILLGSAVLLYRKRQMESAGDFISVKPVAPVFLVLYTLCVGAALYFIADQLNTAAEYVFLLIGFAIGFFTGWMLLEKRVNVFQPMKLIGFGVLTLVFFCSLALTWLDPLGITRYVPAAEQVEKVEICPYASSYYLDTHSLYLADPEDIEKVIGIHTELVENRSTNDNGLCLQLRYHLHDGTLRHRQYYLATDNPVMPTLKTYFSNFRYITQTASVEQLLTHAETIEFHSYYEPLPSFSIIAPDNDSELALEEKYGSNSGWLYFSPETSLEQDPTSRALLQAIQADCEAGTMAQQWEFYGETAEPVGNITIRYAISSYETRYIDLRIYSDCVNTQTFLQNVANMAISE